MCSNGVSSNFCAQHVVNGYISVVVVLKEFWESFSIMSAVYVRPVLLKQDELDLHIGVFRVETFCYLQDMLSYDGGCDHAVLARVNKAWAN